MLLLNPSVLLKRLKKAYMYEWNFKIPLKITDI